MLTAILSVASLVILVAAWGWGFDLLSALFSTEEERLAEWRKANAILREKGRNL